eukprot:339335-Chlamydomonas_euryale.AAC.3
MHTPCPWNPAFLKSRSRGTFALIASCLLETLLKASVRRQALTPWYSLRWPAVRPSAAGVAVSERSSARGHLWKSLGAVTTPGSGYAFWERLRLCGVPQHLDDTLERKPFGDLLAAAEHLRSSVNVSVNVRVNVSVNGSARVGVHVCVCPGGQGFMFLTAAQRLRSGASMCEHPQVAV